MTSKTSSCSTGDSGGPITLIMPVFDINDVNDVNNVLQWLNAQISAQFVLTEIKSVIISFTLASMKRHTNKTIDNSPRPPVLPLQNSVRLHGVIFWSCIIIHNKKFGEQVQFLSVSWGWMSQGEKETRWLYNAEYSFQKYPFPNKVCHFYKHIYNFSFFDINFIAISHHMT